MRRAHKPITVFGSCPKIHPILMNLNIMWLSSRRSLAEATVAPSVSPCGTPRAASVLTAGGEALGDFSQEGQKLRRFDVSARNAAPDSLAAARTPSSRLLPF